MELKPQEEETTNKVVTCKGCGAELKAYAYGKICMCPALRSLRPSAGPHPHPSDRG